MSSFSFIRQHADCDLFQRDLSAYEKIKSKCTGGQWGAFTTPNKTLFFFLDLSFSLSLYLYLYIPFSHTLFLSYILSTACFSSERCRAQGLCYDRDSFVWIIRQRREEQQSTALFSLTEEQYFHKVFLISFRWPIRERRPIETCRIHLQPTQTHFLAPKCLGPLFLKHSERAVCSEEH